MLSFMPAVARLGVLVYTFAATTLASIFVGFSSCGGYAWHRDALMLHTLVCCIAAGLVADERRPRRLGMVATVIALVWVTAWMGLTAGWSLYLNEWASFSSC
jgi:hypothetical protein